MPAFYWTEAAGEDFKFQLYSQGLGRTDPFLDAASKELRNNKCTTHIQGTEGLDIAISIADALRGFVTLISNPRGDYKV